MKKSKFYALCILLAAGAGACESEVTWDGCTDNVCLGNMITCPDGTVVSKDGTCQCQPQNVHCHEGYLYMCGDIIDKTNDDTRIANAVFVCQNGCNKGNTGCETYPAEKIVDVSSDPQICDEQNKSGCLKEEKNTYLCINDKEVVYLDDKKVNFCQESSDSQPQQEYQPCTDNLVSTCKDDKLIMCDAISGMHFVVENCLNGCNEEEKKCNPAPENCVMSCENGELACWIEGNKVASYTCEFGCHENKNECNPISTKCENRSCDGNELVCYMDNGTENGQKLVLEECTYGCDPKKKTCYEQEKQSDSYLNKLLKECSEEPNKDSLENLKLALNGEVVVDAQYFGKCDLKNSILLGVNENNIETVITVKTSSDQPVAPDALFKSIEGSTIANIQFKYDVEYKGSVETSSDPDESQTSTHETTSPKGMLAHEIKDSTLSNLALKGNLNIIAMQSESQIGSLAGVVSQTKMEDMTFTGSIVLSKDNNAQDHINVSNVGGLIGECQGGCEISKVNITADGENLIQLELTGNNSEDIQNVENIGGLVGNVNASELNDKENEFINNDVNGKIYVNAESHKITNLGGMFGSITSNFDINAENIEKYTVSNSNFKGCIELENSLAENIGGVIGTAVQAGISNISFEAENCDSGLNIQTSGLDKSQGGNGSLDVLEYSILKVGGVVGGLTNSMLENINLINTLPSMQLTGAYLNRVGGVVGAAWLSRMKNVQSEQSTITLNVKKNSNENELGIAFVGGLTGKSANTKYSKVNNKTSLDIKAENTEFPKNIQYVGGLFGSM
ncbi:MAG: hypothetical protein J6S69_02435, partial [Proteobacteria bacterium]|nr:hypothetical protein [Pseudomonadota bacterium]